MNRADQLHTIGRRYVASLGAGDFESIPYAEDVQLRAPLCPGGSTTPLIGRTNLKETWWAPLPGLVSGVEVIDSYVNKDQSGVVVEFLCSIDAMSCTLRIIDRFTVNDAGKITSQENFFDPRDVTNPGWRSAA
jgi:SnoaL-like domain